MVIDHVGIVVTSLDQAIEHWKTVFGYRQSTRIIVNTRQRVKVAFLAKNNSLPVKLIEPTDAASPVYALAQRGGGLHHLCFKCAKLDEEISRLSAMGMKVLVKPQPGEAFENENIAFLLVKGGLNIELIDTDKRTGIINDSIDI